MVTPTSKTSFRSTMADTNAVSIKLPTFWTAQPHVWFQAEAQFTICGITADPTKYAYIIAALDQDTASRLLDLLSNPPTDNKYETIKIRLGPISSLMFISAISTLHMDNQLAKHCSFLHQNFFATTDIQKQHEPFYYDHSEV